MQTRSLALATLGIALSVSLLVLGITSASAANPGNPATFDATASVNILAPILIQQTQPLTFGKIVGPIGASATNTYREVGAPTGTGGGSRVTDGTVASWLVAATAGEAAFVTGDATGACSDERVVLSARISSPLAIGSSGSVSFGTGGSITITNAADGSGPLGTVTCPHAMTVAYQ